MQLNGIVFFVLVIALGYLALKCRLVPTETTNVLPSLLLKVCFPAMLFLTFARTDSRQLLDTGLPTVAVTLVFSLLPYLLSIPLLRRMDDARRPLLRYLTGAGNNSFVCLPLLSLFLSGSDLAIVFVYGAVMDFLIWGVYHQLFAGSSLSGRQLIVRNVLTTPNLFAVVAGLLCSIFRISLPGFLVYTLEGLSATVSPLSLLLIGMLICQYGLWNWTHSKIAILYSVGKVLALPLLVFACTAALLPLRMALILSMLLGAPAPISAVLWCKQYGRDTQLAVQCLIPSTVLYFAVYGALLLVLSARGIL